MSGRILLVDDDPATLGMLRRCLEELEPPPTLVAEAMNGEQAVRTAEEIRPDVVLMDAIMPVMTGIEASRLIRERFPETRIILFSGHKESWIRAQGLQFGVASYFEKCQPQSTIRRAVARALQASIEQPGGGGGRRVPVEPPSPTA